MRKVTAHTMDVFTSAKGAAMTFTAVTVLLVQMSDAHLKAWNWLQDEDGQHPMSGYEVRDTTGALLGLVITVGWLTGHIHTEVYDPATNDFYAAGECAQITSQGIARVLEARQRMVGPVPAGDDWAPAQPLPTPRNQACPFGYCFDPECIDHGPIWADAPQTLALA